MAVSKQLQKKAAEKQRVNELKQVSVIIPVYNCAPYLEKCFQSVIAQSYKNIEIIVINDGSTDRSGEIIKKYADKNANILVIEQENLGVSAARNKGIERAGGQYLLFLDGDDYIGEKYVEALVKAAEEYQSDVVICGFTMVDETGRKIQKVVPEGYERERQEEWAYRLSSVWSHLYRKSVWMDTRIRFPEGVRGEDLPITLFFNYACRNIVMLPEAEYYYVQHSDSAMGTFRGLKSFRLPIESINEVLEKLCNIEEHNSYEFLEYGVLKAFAMFLFDLGRGADWQLIRQICRDTENTIQKFFPKYIKNKKYRWNSHSNMPLAVKGAVWLLARLMQFHMLKPFMWIYCRLT